MLISRQGTADKPIFVIKDPASGRFFRFGETEHFIAQQLDGATSPETVRERVAERFGISLPPEVLDQFVVRLRTLGLVTDRPPEADTPTAFSLGSSTGSSFSSLRRSW
ncbi:MAG: hypothetical protein DMG24_10370 [Acidobacteria bacterium]|nr:MAG: hypothetical protein DMG24_10370 [Acidobacteriota bacterium]